MCSWSRLACFACALACAEVGCGRVGFDDLERSVGSFDAGIAASDASVDMDASPPDARPPGNDATVSMEAGTLPFDAATARDAAQLSDGALEARDADTGLPDAEIPELFDGGRESDAGPAGFCGAFASALACADFSAFPPGFERHQQNGDLTVSHGTLKARTTRAGGIAAIRAAFEPVFSGTLYARFLVRVPRNAQVTAINLLALAEPAGTGTEEIDANLLTGDGVDLFVLSTNARYIGPARAFERNTFQCWEVMVHVDDTAGRMRVDVDGKNVLTSGQTDTAFTHGIGRVALGIDYTSAQQVPVLLELDDFVLARERLSPCP
jgi:hypothetical protein